MPANEIAPETGRLLHCEAEEYLANLRVLASELDRAMKAVVNQELWSLKESVRLQRETCARLSYFGRPPESRLANNPHLEAIGPESDIANEIKAAIDRLLTLNRTYSALLRHSGDTLRVFATLFRGHYNSAPTSSGGQANLRTWSCEL